MNTHACIVLSASLAMAAGCVTPGPVDDGFELSQESIDIGKFLGNESLSARLVTSEDDSTRRKQGEVPEGKH